MRLALFLCLLPGLSLAETITLDSRPTQVEMLQGAAEVTRVVSFEIPAGTHDLIIPDLPVAAQTDGMLALLDGARLQSLSVRDNAAPLDRDTADIAAARAAVQAAEEALLTTQDDMDALRRQSAAAGAQLDFLAGLTEAKSLPPDAEALAAIAQMVADQTEAAQAQQAAAAIALRPLQRVVEDRARDVAQAQAALDALLTAGEDRQQATLVVRADQAGPVTLTLTYYIRGARWQPTYALRLTEGDAPTLTIARGAWIYQDSGEDWQDVTLTLSTANLNRGMRSSEPISRRLRIFEPPSVQPRSNMSGGAFAEADPIIEAPVIVEDAAFANIDGPATRYTFPARVSVANEADALRIALDTLTLEPDVFARATPSLDDIAYRVAHVTNTLGEMLLPSDEAEVFVDGQFIGFTQMPMIPPGAEADIALGALETLTLERNVRRGTGDTGLILRANERQERETLRITNTGPRAWPVRLRSAVPYSEQEDLEITWSAAPAPTLEDVEGQQGILEWQFDLPPGATREIALQTRITWPTGMSLR